MSAGGTPFKKGYSHPRSRKAYSEPPATLEEYSKRAKGVDCGGLPPEVGWHVTNTQQLQPAVMSAVITAYYRSDDRKKLLRVLMRKYSWVKLAFKRERDAATAAVEVTRCEGEHAVSGGNSSSSGVSAAETKPLKKGSSFSIAVLRLLLSFITLLPFRALSTRTLALQFNGWCERNGLDVPTLHHVGVYRAITEYIPEKFGVKLDVRSLLFSPKRLTARVADM
jgi:hypothetical protein